MKKEDLIGFKYSPTTGMLYRCFSGGVVRQRKNAFQKIVGTKTADGYLTFKYKNKIHRVHRAAWSIMNKGADFPCGKFIDHINGDKSDNRWKNLRVVTTRQNGQNRKDQRNKKLVGARRDRAYWSSRINIGNERLNLGWFKTELEAHTAYMNYMDKHKIPYLPEIDKREKS